MKNILAIALPALLLIACGGPAEEKIKESETAVSKEMNSVPVNPFLIQNSIYPMVHWNSASSDVTTIKTWEGNSKITEDQIQWMPMPPSNVGMAHYPYPNGEEAIFISGSNRTAKIRVTGDAFELISVAKVPGYNEMDATEEELRALEKAMSTDDEAEFLAALHEYCGTHGTNGSTLAYGVYTLLDKDGNYYSGWGTTIYKFADENHGDINSPIKIVASYDVKDGLSPEDAAKISRLVGLNITYDGNIVVGMPGIVAVLDRKFSNMSYVIFDGEAIDNGVTVDSDGGIYAVTSKYMRKLIWDGKELSNDVAKGAWKSEYNNIPNEKAFSRGAGNTPTLMGFGDDEDHLVIVCDAGDPVSVIAFWRDEIPADFEQQEGTKSRRVACQTPLTIDVPATIEWSPHVSGYGVMMFASAWPDPYKIDGKLDVYSTVHTAGVSRKAPRGSEKFVWDPKTRKLTSVWTTDYSMQWALFPMSAASNTVSLCELENGIYSIVSVDWTTGKEVAKTELGTSPIFNTMGGFYIPLSNGDWLVTGTFGPVRISKN